MNLFTSCNSTDDLFHSINIIVDKNERNAITGQVMKLLVGDIKDSWKFVIKATDRLIANNETLRFSSPHVTKEEVADLLTSIVTLDGEVLRMIILFPRQKFTMYIFRSKYI